MQLPMSEAGRAMRDKKGKRATNAARLACCKVYETTADEFAAHLARQVMLRGVDPHTGRHHKVRARDVVFAAKDLGVEAYA